MFYRYYLYTNGMWRTGKVNSDTVEGAAKLVKKLYQIECQESTIILYTENEENGCE